MGKNNRAQRLHLTKLQAKAQVISERMEIEYNKKRVSDNKWRITTTIDNIEDANTSKVVETLRDCEASITIETKENGVQQFDLPESLRNF